jgi:hypothetical protein
LLSFETHKIIQRPRSFVLLVYLQSKVLVPTSAADGFGIFDRRFPEAALTKALANLKFVQEAESAVKLQAEAKGQHHISGDLSTGQNQVGLAGTRREQGYETAAGDILVVIDSFVDVKFPH